MNALLSWIPARSSPSRGFYSSLAKEDMLKLYSRRLIRALLMSAVVIAVFLLLRPLLASSTSILVVKSSFDWSTYNYHHPLQSIAPLPSGKPHLFPPIQYKFQPESKSAAIRRKPRQQAVLDAFKKCWQSYKTHAWMKDELQPISGKSKETFGGWAATLVDSLDTLWIMGLKKEFQEAVRAVASIDWEITPDTACNMFETNIRHLGGLLAAYDLSREPALLVKAVELGDMLYAGFDTPNHMPPFWLDFQKAKTGQLIAGDHQISAALGSFSLEFTRLSQITGDPKYYDAIARVTSVFLKHQNFTQLPGMWPTHINARDQIFSESEFTLGALADSLYEYLPKMHYLLGGLEPAYEKAYRSSMATAIEHLLFRPMLPNNTNVLVAGSATAASGRSNLNPEGQHLSCFAGGMFILGGKLFSLPEHVDIGARLTQGCVYAYNAFPTGIMPEIFRMRPCPSFERCEWDADQASETLPEGFASVPDRSYSLRPEALESVFLLYRTTGNVELQNAAWKMFKSIQAATETEYANAAIDDVTTSGKPSQRDSMESFWLAETLKYLYLIFSPPDLISLDDYVLNTEAHPLKRPK
ncbi:hypothetical protein Z517_11130 [Fonsecaea pedrosoi CBS 271.37]|uniref:alpha-1,2-Mannosidase n=1 Tax=Fonsecaea pedrosoi CBS 271.37 TaxID=1442368 RepID=A0A0D2GVI6_9EURO|nr:uncharacterized protein Z517_11130 [Fonsecaea pedrosoi CBS 271.37]KIW76384.1 hypothetical protein Z517_11130 [Fonsecaea pedrosoi CBS 271.37]